MRPEDFDFICRMLRERSGLVLNKDKGYLLESRLIPVAQRHELAGLDALIAKLRAGGNEALCVEVTEAMTTNESFFFRDEHVFTGFRDKILPAIMEARAGKRQFRIWCAAASSGQEPYTLAMIMKEAAAKLDGWQCEILGTDLSHDILDRAKDGLYSQFEVQRGLPVQLLVKYFEKDGQMWRISPEIKSMVRYEEFNLLDDMSKLGSFDIVFCRNVLIYFDQDTKAQILGRIADLMPADGTLILGGAETVIGISDRFAPKPEQRGVYCKTGAEKKAPVASSSAAPTAIAASPAPPAPAPKPGLAAATAPKSLAPRPTAPATAPAAPAPKPAGLTPRPAAPTAAPATAPSALALKPAGLTPRPAAPTPSPTAPAPTPTAPPAPAPSPAALAPARAPAQATTATAALAARAATIMPPTKPAADARAVPARPRPAVPPPASTKPAPASPAASPAKPGASPSASGNDAPSRFGART